MVRRYAHLGNEHLARYANELSLSLPDFGTNLAHDAKAVSKDERKLLKNGGPCAVRTRDHLIKSQMLYQLS